MIAIQENLNEFLGRLSIISAHIGSGGCIGEDIDDEQILYESLEVPDFAEKALSKMPVDKSAKLMTLLMIPVCGLPGAISNVTIAETTFELLYGDSRSQWMTYFNEEENMVVFNVDPPEWYIVPATMLELAMGINRMIDGIEFDEVACLILSAIPVEDRLDFAQARLLESEFRQDVLEALLKNDPFHGFKTETAVQETNFWRKVEQKILAEQS